MFEMPLWGDRRNFVVRVCIFVRLYVVYTVLRSIIITNTHQHFNTSQQNKTLDEVFAHSSRKDLISKILSGFATGNGTGDGDDRYLKYEQLKTTLLEVRDRQGYKHTRTGN